jgi:ribosomal protein S18 acetylase RimI-like enzyme
MTDDTKKVFIAAWSAFAEPFPTSFSKAHDHLQIACAGIPVPLFNSAFPMDEGILSHAQFADLARKFTDVLADREIPGLLILRSAQVDGRVGLAPLFKMPGMVAGTLLAPKHPPKKTDIREVRGLAMAADMAGLNAEAHGMTALDAEWMTCSQLWEAPSPNHGFLLYEQDEAVAAGSSTFVEGVSYIGWMATREKFRGRGYAEAILRHMDEFMKQRYGVTESVLHATELGKPIYERIGFRCVDEYSCFLCGAAESAAHS